MRTVGFVLLTFLFISNYCHGETVDASQIRLFLERVDDSLVRGNIYHINYQVWQRRTDAYALLKSLVSATAP